MIFKTLAETLEYLHSYHIVMRDLTTSNIMMKNTSDTGMPRLSSVQNAIIIAPNATIVGSDFMDIHFKAPEVVKQMPYNSKVDCWAYGVALYYSLALKLPFVEKSG